jgi:broad specificity phosphatase PhoE
MMRVIVVRHFKTVNNAQRRIIGWGDSPPAEDWEEDLIKTDSVFRDHGLRFDAIYSSNLTRARKTAQWLADRVQGGVTVQSAPELNEVNYGELSQLPKQWATDQFPEYKTDPDYVFPGGESFAEMRRRSVGYLLSRERAHAQQTILLVAHAGVIRGLVTRLLNLPYAPNLRRKISHRYVGDFTIDRQRCLRYDELGQPSGFIADGAIEIPFSATATGTESEPRSFALADWVSGPGFSAQHSN